MRDVAHVRDGFAPQTNIVRQDGARGALMSHLQKRQRLHAATSCTGIKDIVPRGGAELCRRN